MGYLQIQRDQGLVILLRYSALTELGVACSKWNLRKTKHHMKPDLVMIAFSEYIYALILARAKLDEGCTPLDFVFFRSALQN